MPNNDQGPRFRAPVTLVKGPASAHPPSNLPQRIQQRIQRGRCPGARGESCLPMLSEVLGAGQESKVRPFRPRFNCSAGSPRFVPGDFCRFPDYCPQGTEAHFRFVDYVRARLRSVFIAITASRSRVPTRIEWRCPMAVPLRCSLLPPRRGSRVRGDSHCHAHLASNNADMD